MRKYLGLVLLAGSLAGIGCSEHHYGYPYYTGGYGYYSPYYYSGPYYRYPGMYRAYGYRRDHERREQYQHNRHEQMEHEHRKLQARFPRAAHVSRLSKR